MAQWNRMLVAIDGEAASLKALRYVGNITSHLSELYLCLLHVYPPPPPDYYNLGGSLDEYQADQEKRIQSIFTKAAAVLAEFNVTERVEYRVEMAERGTISETVLKIVRDGDFGTVVVGKRGVSRAEEFLFGSISNSLAQHSKDFCAWIVG
jgi:nucleotide-binding universal stress UspA family protein